MEKQKVFKSTYISKLKEDLKSGKTDHLYKEKTFEFNKEKVLVLPMVFKPEGLLEKMNVSNDYESAIALYEAYSNFTPIQAADERLWTYLAHVDLFSYMRKRWRKHIEGKIDNEIKYILEHWFLQSSSQQSLMRHSLSGLWWAVYLSKDDNRDDKYELTKILFRQLDFPTRTLGTYNLGRHREAVIGILQFIKDNDEIFQSKFEKKTRYITKYLNLVGGTINLAYFDRNFFINELEKVKDKIKNI